MRVKIEAALQASLGISATLLSSRDIADFIIENDLENELVSIAGIDLSRPRSADRIDKHEVMLHAYMILGYDAQKLRESVYDDTIILALHESNGPLTVGHVAARTAQLLGNPSLKGQVIQRRIDSLAVRGTIVRDKSLVYLSPEMRATLLASNQIYDSELEELANLQRSVINRQSQAEWTLEVAKRAALLTAKAFVWRQITGSHAEQAKHTYALLGAVGDPLQDLRDLVYEYVPGSAKSEECVQQIVSIGSQHPLVAKLTRSALYLTIEQVKSRTGVLALGTRSWRDQRVLIETSVAIPFLCTKIYGGTTGRFSSSANACVSLLAKKGADVRIPRCYLHECAAHLLGALEHQPLVAKFGNDLQYSPNGFVSNYLRLRSADALVPDTLEGFLKTFSRSVSRPDPNWSNRVERVALDLVAKFVDYSINIEEYSDVNPLVRKDVENAYKLELHGKGLRKSRILFDNDVDVLSHMAHLALSRGGNVVCLTWEGAMIRVSQHYGDCGCVVSPEVAYDFVQLIDPGSESKLLSLLHSIPKAGSRAEEASALFLDRIVRMARTKLDDWQFQESIDKFRNEMLNRIDFESPSFMELISDETDRFLNFHGISDSKNA